MFSWRNKKNINTFGLKKKTLIRAMMNYVLYHIFGDMLEQTAKIQTKLLIQEQFDQGLH